MAGVSDRVSRALRRAGTGGLPALAALALVLAACEYPGVPHPLAAEAAPQAGGPGDGIARTAGQVPAGQGPGESAAARSAPGSGNPTAGVAQSTIRVTQRDFKLDPNEVTAKAGPVTFVLKNEGRYTHDFRVQGQGVDERAPKVGSGRTQEWRITLKPGSYRISCPISNHADRGMVGTLTVVP